VSRFSTIHVLENTYSVPSRLIGAWVTVRLRAETMEVYVGTVLACVMPRLSGHQRHAIDDHHVAWSLVRKPGAFAAYRYRDDLFPTLAFRHAYDRLQRERPRQADRDYVRLLHLAAGTAESEVETALRRRRWLGTSAGTRAASRRAGRRCATPRAPSRSTVGVPAAARRSSTSHRAPSRV